MATPREMELNFRDKDEFMAFLKSQPYYGKLVETDDFDIYPRDARDVVQGEWQVAIIGDKPIAMKFYKYVDDNLWSIRMGLEGNCARVPSKDCIQFLNVTDHKASNEIPTPLFHDALSQLEYATGQLHIFSRPNAATIYIDGEDTGKLSSTTLPATPGSRTIRLEFKGFEPWEETVDVRAFVMHEIIAHLGKPRSKTREEIDEAYES